VAAFTLEDLRGARRDDGADQFLLVREVVVELGFAGIARGPDVVQRGRVHALHVHQLDSSRHDARAGGGPTWRQPPPRLCVLRPAHRPQAIRFDHSCRRMDYTVPLGRGSATSCLAVDLVAESDRGQLGEIVQRVRDGRLRTNIGNVATLDDAVAALNSIERRKGKTIISVRP
jgi:hypothetical protein